MPRVCWDGKEVDDWMENESDGSGTSTFDICEDCFDNCDTEEFAEKLQPYNGDPQSEEIIDAGIPEAISMIEDRVHEGSPYECEVCGIKLTGKNF